VKPFDRVIFRMWDGEIIAIFPEIPATRDYGTCLSYQHGECDPEGIIADSRPATPAEYADLERELKNAGYRVAPVARMHARYRIAREYAISKSGGVLQT
jgi:hypothetical protein